MDIWTLSRNCCLCLVCANSINPESHCFAAASKSLQCLQEIRTRLVETELGECAVFDFDVDVLIRLFITSLWWQGGISVNVFIQSFAWDFDEDVVAIPLGCECKIRICPSVRRSYLYSFGASVAAIVYHYQGQWFKIQDPIFLQSGDAGLRIIIRAAWCLAADP